MRKRRKRRKSTFLSKRGKIVLGLIILTLVLCLGGCAPAHTLNENTQVLTYPEGRKFTPQEQAAAAKEIEDAGCDPDKTPPTDGQPCKIPTLIEMLKDAVSVLDQLAVARNAYQE